MLAGQCFPITEAFCGRISSLERERAYLSTGAAPGPWGSLVSESLPALETGSAFRLGEPQSPVGGWLQSRMAVSP